MEGSLGEEWDLLLEQFKGDLAQSADQKAPSKKEWIKKNWNRPTKAFFSAIRPPLSDTHVKECYYKGAGDKKTTFSTPGNQHKVFAKYYGDLSLLRQKKSISGLDT